MKHRFYLFSLVLFATILVACARFGAAPETTGKNIMPGDKIGTMTVEEHLTTATYPVIGGFCGNYLYDDKEPATHTTNCKVPRYPRLQFDFGWTSKDAATLEANWQDMTWEMYIDGYQIALEEFGQWDQIEGREKNPSERGWIIDLIDPAPGEHTLRLLWKSDTAIDDGFDVYAPGVYENIVNFTVLEN